MTNTHRNARIAGWSSLLCACCHLSGFFVILVWLPDFIDGVGTRLHAATVYGVTMAVWYSIIFFLFGSSLLVFTYQIQQLTRNRDTTLRGGAIMASYVWVAYLIASGIIAVGSIIYINQLSDSIQTETWYAIDTIQNGLGNGVEWVGGIWMLLINALFLQQRWPSVNVAVLGLIAGVAGLLTIIPPLANAGAVFGMLQIVWFIWIASRLLRAPAVTPASA